MAVSVRDIDSDSALVRAAQDGDRDAFGELFRRHYSSVRRACARRLANVQEGDEIAQAAFVRAWERIDRCQGDRRFGGWIQVIAQRLCFDHIRDRGRTSPTDVADDAPTLVIGDVPEDALMRNETTALVQLALADLPPRQRDVVVARDLHDRRAPEIAAALGLSVGAVDSLLLRGRRRLVASLTRLSGERGAATASSSSVVATAAASTPRLSAFVQSIQSAIDRVSYAVAAAFGVVPGAAGPLQRAVGAALLTGALAAGVGAATTAPATPALPGTVAAPAVSIPQEVAVAPPVAAPAAPTVAAPAAPTVAAPVAPAAPAAPAVDPLTAVATGAVTDVVRSVARVLDQLGVSSAVRNLTR